MPPLHIASIGIEKLIPRVEHLGVFVRLLSRSALGSPMTQYTSHFRAPRRGGEMHVVLVDNGRTARLGMERVLDLAQMHTLRGVYEHVPSVPAERRAKLWRDVLWADWPHPGSNVRSEEVLGAAILVQLERILQQRLPGEDQYSRADLRMAKSDVRVARNPVG